MRREAPYSDAERTQMMDTLRDVLAEIAVAQAAATT